MKKHLSAGIENIIHPYYSSDLLVRSLVRAGIPRYKAYQITHGIWEDIKGQAKTEKKLERKVIKIIKEKYPELLDRYRNWRGIMRKNKPLIILLGGSTGIGTSTMAVRLGWLLEINQILGTDSVREVIRGFLPKRIEPLLNVSTYETGELMEHIHSHEDALIYGFLSQSRKVIYGVEAVIKRAIKEKMNIVIEGVHLVPGIINFLSKYEHKATIIPVLLDVDQEEKHRQHFLTRQLQNANRAKKKYIDHFREIRTIRDYLFSQAKKNKIPVIENYSIHHAEKEILNVIYELFYSKKKKK